MMRLWVRLHCRPTPPSEEDIAREVHAYVLKRLPQREPALAMAGAPAPTPSATSRGELSRSTESDGLRPRIPGRALARRLRRLSPGLVARFAACSRSPHSASASSISNYSLRASAVRAPAWPRPARLPSCSSLRLARAARRSPRLRRRRGADAPDRSPPPVDTQADPRSCDCSHSWSADL